MEYAIKCVNQLAGKRGLFCSDEGRFGTGPLDAMAGDEIFCLEGVTTAMILRKSQEGRYTVVGPAVVPGLSFMRETSFNKDKWVDVTLI